ncbi:MAG TPA: FHA domain-containing protein [Candidatus Acidoferrales bacterium]|nr:FHA domain-containing protein [Candidatus Acidoferrales bacterium]
MPDDDDEKTHIGAKPPPKLPGALKPPPTAASQDAPATSQVPDAPDDEEATVFEARPRSNFRLQRVQPAGHSEILILDRASYVAGRLPTCEIRLLTPSASREHARLECIDGEWWVEPIGDRVVQVNGTPIRDKTKLSHQVILKLGGDELIFLDERAALAKLAPAAAPASAPSRRLPLVPLVAVLAALLAIAIWWFAR